MNNKTRTRIDKYWWYCWCSKKSKAHVAGNTVYRLRYMGWFLKEYPHVPQVNAGIIDPSDSARRLVRYCLVRYGEVMIAPLTFNTLRPRQNGRRFADGTFKRIFFNENVRISIKISLKFVPKGPINNNPALVQIMAWRQSGDKPLSEPMMVSLRTHICVTRPQWVNYQHLLHVW